MYNQPQPMPQAAPQPMQQPQPSPQQVALLKQALAARQVPPQAMPQNGPQMAQGGQMPPQAASQPQMAQQQPVPSPINPQQAKLAAALSNAKVAQDQKGGISVVMASPDGSDIAQSKTSSSGNLQTTKEVKATPVGPVVSKTTKQVKAVPVK
jgi:hypothetical protein